MLGMFAFRILLILIIILILTVLSNIVFERIKQKKDWNNGRCPKCNGKWIFKTDDYYEREYVCENNLSHKCTITYKDIDGRR